MDMEARAFFTRIYVVWALILAIVAGTASCPRYSLQTRITEEQIYSRHTPCALIATVQKLKHTLNLVPIIV